MKKVKWRWYKNRTGRHIHQRKVRPLKCTRQGWLVVKLFVLEWNESCAVGCVWKKLLLFRCEYMILRAYEGSPKAEVYAPNNQILDNGNFMFCIKFCIDWYLHLHQKLYGFFFNLTVKNLCWDIISVVHTSDLSISKLHFVVL